MLTFIKLPRKGRCAVHVLVLVVYNKVRATSPLALFTLNTLVVDLGRLYKVALFQPLIKFCTVVIFYSSTKEVYCCLDSWKKIHILFLDFTILFKQMQEESAVV